LIAGETTPGRTGGSGEGPDASGDFGANI
jgi:hypothetical protein